MPYNSLTSLFAAICDSIRGKTGNTDSIYHQDIPRIIEGLSIDGGGGGGGGGETSSSGIKIGIKSSSFSRLRKVSSVTKQINISGNILTTSSIEIQKGN